MISSSKAGRAYVMNHQKGKKESLLEQKHKGRRIKEKDE
jgi:hypothetical protein